MNVDAPDSRTCDRARKTFIYTDDRLLLCRSFAVRTKPEGKKLVMLEAIGECFDIIEDENCQKLLRIRPCLATETQPEGLFLYP